MLKPGIQYHEARTSGLESVDDKQDSYAPRADVERERSNIAGNSTDLTVYAIHHHHPGLRH
jgi:hypothetical protein